MQLERAGGKPQASSLQIKEHPTLYSFTLYPEVGKLVMAKEVRWRRKGVRWGGGYGKGSQVGRGSRERKSGRERVMAKGVSGHDTRDRNLS